MTTHASGITMHKVFILAHATARQRAIDSVRSAPDGYRVEIRQQTRTLEQNARMWAMLGEIAEQVVWYGQKLTAEEWKDVLTAGLKRQKVVPGIDGGFVVIGARTSKMTRTEMAELTEVAYAFGAQQGVRFRAA